MVAVTSREYQAMTSLYSAAKGRLADLLKQRKPPRNSAFGGIVRIFEEAYEHPWLASLACTCIPGWAAKMQANIDDVVRKCLHGKDPDTVAEFELFFRLFHEQRAFDLSLAVSESLAEELANRCADALPLKPDAAGQELQANIREACRAIERYCPGSLAEAHAKQIIDALPAIEFEEA